MSRQPLLLAALGATVVFGPVRSGVPQRAPEPVTVFLVRHAETEPRTPARPDRLLSVEGKARAAALRDLLAHAGVTHLFSSDYPRTRGTLAPLVMATGLRPALVSPREPEKQLEALRALPAGSVAVVAGHSNTLPPLIAALGGEVKGLTPRGFLAEHSHDRLFVVTLAGAASKLLELRYGAPSRRAGKAAPRIAPEHVRIVPEDARIGAAHNPRESCSLFFYSKTPASLVVHGQIELTYGSPTWKAEYDTALAQAKAGTRFRLGNNFFATLDSSCSLAIGDVELAPGMYYLALQRGGKGEMRLVFLDPAPIRAKRLNSNQSAELRGGRIAKMRWRRMAQPVEKLRIEMTPVAKGGPVAKGAPAAKGGPAATLRIRFGPHELTQSIRAVLH